MIISRVKELVEPILAEMGFELIDAVYVSTAGRWVLRLYIDKDGGVTIDDCARVSVEIGDLVDVKDVIRHEYTLEVSSPGLNRPLTRDKDLMGAVGKKVKVKTGAPINGRRNFVGYLKTFSGDKLFLDVENQQVVIPWSDVKKANLEYEFNA
ncbi:MAG: ribosome maturation factor RimP [Pseudomonadota bacterium]